MKFNICVEKLAARNDQIILVYGFKNTTVSFTLLACLESMNNKQCQNSGIPFLSSCQHLHTSWGYGPLVLVHI